MWGTTTFEAATDAADRRQQRIGRRRYDRRQQRVQLIGELFASEIGQIDPGFFRRLTAGRLFREDAGEPYTLFNDPDFTDKDYYKAYPTIHHLLCDLMNSDEPHDVRLVYLACIWLVAHRGHFLSDVDVDNVGELLDFSSIYNDFMKWLDENGYAHPWNTEVTAEQMEAILCRKLGVSKKQELFKTELCGGKKLSKDLPEDTPFTQEGVVKLLSGAKVAFADLFQKNEYKELENKSIALSSGEEEFTAAMAEIGDDAELLIRLRAMADCAELSAAQGGKATLSEAKVETYEQHHRDLQWLKAFVRKYIPEKYKEIFIDAGKANYTAYSYNAKRAKTAPEKKATKTNFCDYIKKTIQDVTPEPEDEGAYRDAIERLAAYSFMPKQKDTDNRVIPYQIYYHELDLILNRAEKYLPFLTQPDEDGLTPAGKIRSVFAFRIPYFVGPLNPVFSENAWLVRKAEGKIYPWNIDKKVDYEASEKAFIDRMTNMCTYLPGESVLPKNSLLYSEYTILNEINNIRIDNVPIPTEAKRGVFEDLFKTRARVSVKAIREWLISNNFAEKKSEITGLDTTVKSTYKPYLSFKRLLSSGQLSVEDVETIIEQMAYTEEKARMRKWLATRFPQLSEEDRKYVANLGFKDFGRLSRRFLTGLYGTERGSDEALSVMDVLRSRSENLMQILSGRYDFMERVEEAQREYYAAHASGLEGRLNEMHISGPVKRPIYRTMDIVEDVVKAVGCAPKKIFVEMARGASDDQRGKRTVSRKQQILELYKTAEADTTMLEKQLDEMGDTADNRLQSDRLFLYYCQLGKCIYTGERIELEQLGSKRYDIDHIYPQSAVKDDSILNNRVLCTSESNGAKSDMYPIPSDWRAKMQPFWHMLKESKLITEEKYRRLTRATPFTEEERWGFINRQLVETRQSTKAVTELLKERFGDETEIVYVKAGLVSDFRQQFNLLKSRAVNDLHHAKDAYLNVVVGNVYHMKYDRRWFSPSDKYNVKTDKMFTHVVQCGKETVWEGNTDLAKVCSVMKKNNIHVTRYAFCRKGGFFDQNPVKAAPGLVPLKANLPTEKYGGYNKPTASYYLLAAYTMGKKKDIMFVPVELMFASKVEADAAFAEGYLAEQISQINGGKKAENVHVLLNGRKIKINTVLEMDGMRVTISGKDSGGSRVLLRAMMPLVIGTEWEQYVKRLESISEKMKNNTAIHVDEMHDGVTAEKNCALYDILTEKATNPIYSHCPGNIGEALTDGKDVFHGLPLPDQINCLLKVAGWFGSAPGGCDLTAIKKSKASGVKVQSVKMSNLAKNYKSLCIIDMSASGLYESRSENLLKLL